MRACDCAFVCRFQPQIAQVNGKVLVALCYAVQAHAALHAPLQDEQLLIRHTLVAKTQI